MEEVSYEELLEHSYRQTALNLDADMTPLEFLSEHIFDFTTYDSAMGELFASKALEVCAAIGNRTTFDYIKEPEGYRWYLLMVNMPFFAGRLEWGTSIRGAWWDYEDHILESCGLWSGEKQLLSLKFSQAEWQNFVAALSEFASKGA